MTTLPSHRLLPGRVRPHDGVRLMVRVARASLNCSSSSSGRPQQGACLSPPTSSSRVRWTQVVSLSSQRQTSWLVSASRQENEQRKPSLPEPGTLGGGSDAWVPFLLVMTGAGAIGGTLLDGIHSAVGLQTYSPQLALALGPLHTSLAVPPLLGLYYAVLGSLFVLSDGWLRPLSSSSAVPSQSANASTSTSPAGLGLCLLAAGLLAAELELSATLYSGGTPFPLIALPLALASLLNWFTFDRSKNGLVLAVICALGAPLCEVVLIRGLVELSGGQIQPLWSYPKADLDLGAGWGGFVSWVPWCYGFYTPCLGLWSRTLWEALNKREG